MPYSYTNSKGTTYYLHARDARGGGGRKLYFFAKEPKEGTVDELPAGYEVSEAGTGLPVLKKAQGQQQS